MNEQTVIDLAASTVWITVQVAGPALIAALVMGLLVSVFQAATQINEQTITFIPKVALMLVAMLVCGPWILQKLMSFTITLFQEIPRYGR